MSDKALTRESGFATRAIHAGQEPDATTGAVVVPLYQTSTYAQAALGRNQGYEYARTHNLTRASLERNLAALEGGAHGLCFASGLAATNTLMQTLSAGDHVVAGDNLYGGSYRLFTKVLERLGLRFTFVPSADTASFERSFRPETKLVFVETPTNPMMQLTDLAAVAALARPRGIKLVVDNTFMTPYFQRPLALGADVVLHSVTKYLNGHSDMIGGIAIVKDDSLAERIQFIANAAGAVPGPFDAWLALRGTKTLHLRMRQHDINGQAIARWLVEQLGSESVMYVGLASHPQHELARRQMSGFGGMISIELGSRERAAYVLKRVRVFSLAESLGGVESLISHPATMTHASVTPEFRQQLGITDGLVRLSCGVEDTDDLLADLEQAFEGLPASRQRDHGAKKAVAAR